MFIHFTGTLEQGYIEFKQHAAGLSDAETISGNSRTCDITPIEFQIPEHSAHSKLAFTKLHPIHLPTCSLSHFFVKKIGNATVKRNWLSYNEFDEKYYCSICMAFSDNDTPFKKGIVLTRKHGMGQVVTHETSKSHMVAANIYMQMDSSKTVDTLLNHEQNLLRSSQVKQNQDVVKRLINWILLIGRQGLAYRGSAEAIKYFSDTSVNHGNFLEILRTAGLHDPKSSR